MVCQSEAGLHPTGDRIADSQSLEQEAQRFNPKGSRLGGDKLRIQLLKYKNEGMNVKMIKLIKNVMLQNTYITQFYTG